MTKSKPAARRNLRAWLWALGAAVGAVVLVAGGTVVYAHIRYNHTIAPNIVVAGEDLGGLTEAQARTRIQTAIDAVNATPITLTGDKINETLTANDLGIRYDATATAAAAFANGRVPSPVRTVLNQLTLLIGRPVAVPVVVTFNTQAVADRRAMPPRRRTA